MGWPSQVSSSWGSGDPMGGSGGGSTTWGGTEGSQGVIEKLEGPRGGPTMAIEGVGVDGTITVFYCHPLRDAARPLQVTEAQSGGTKGRVNQDQADGGT